MKINAFSDIGKHRENNEDCFVFGKVEDAAYLAVFDGMGGVKGGEVASAIARDTIQNQLELSYSPKMKPAAIERMLISALTAANLKIFEYANTHELAGMGTTAVVAVVKDNTAYIAYDGDSRAYLIHDGIEQLTSDHTYVNELFKLGKITADEMLADSRKNIITRALGVADTIDVDVLCIDLSEGDMLLLCSDGLNNCLSDEQILSATRLHPLEEIPKALIDLANENGGYDNITAAVLLNEEA